MSTSNARLARRVGSERRLPRTVVAGLPTPDHALTLTIDQLGDGGDGWAVDFVTVGVTTVPGPAGAGLLAIAGLAAARRRR